MTVREMMEQEEREREALVEKRRQRMQEEILKKERQNQKCQQNALEDLFHGNPSFDLIISRQKGGTQFGKTDRNFQQFL